ncbi:MAG TPA: vWA domain-containing protein [Kofleriaceae bacterium]|nr:vWA domain-containing protein [Kofleriaceae bacterium]
MIVRQRVVTYGISTIAAGTVALALWLRPWAGGSIVDVPTVSPTPVDTANHQVDVVFAVDTTGSMGGLLEGAKRTVWSIATHVKDVDPQADLHVGLVAYRDLGDDYVTKDFALSGDMDAVFAELSAYQAAGGGDTPEDVDAALYDAVHKMQWRDGAKKLIFLVGDAPPASRGDVPKFDVSARAAAARQITLNTIRCGDATDTAQAWQQIASLGKGEFSTIEENGGVQQVATPYDEKMAELSGRIDSTTVIYGEHATRARYAAKMAAAAPAPATTKADRASWYAKAPAKKGRDDADMVAGYESGDVDLGKLDTDKLPEDMRGKSKDEIKAELDRRVADRKAAQVELQKLAKERDAYLKAHTGASAGSGSFDTAVEATVEHEL